jgi:hypothetical protein
MTGTGGTRRSGGPAGVSTTDQEHGPATPETPGVRVHTLSSGEMKHVGDLQVAQSLHQPGEQE